MASEQFASLINGKKIAASAALPGSTLAKQLEGIADGAYRVVTLTADEHPVPDVEKPSHKLLYLTKDEDPSLLDAYTEWIYHENEWIIVGSTALNPDNYKLKQTAVDESGNTLKTLTRIQQNANGEITPTFSDIQTASTSQSGVVQLAGSIGATVETENNKAASEKAVRDAINDLDVLAMTGSTSKTITSISETDGLIDATYQDILVGESNIDTGAVTTEKIANGAVTGAKIASETITSDNIKNGTIQSEDIGAGEIHETNIATNAVTNDKVADNAINTDQLVDDAVTGDKIASETITSDNIQNGTIQSEDIGAGQVTTTNIADSAVTTEKIGHDAVNGDKIADGAVDNEHIAADAVHETQILDGSVTRDKIANDAVNGDKIADDAIDNEHIADNAVHTEQIQDGSVTNSKITDGAVDYTKVTDTEGHPFAINISGNAATATNVEEGGRLDQRIGALETGKKDKQAAKADPSNSGNTENFQFISTITQNVNGEITATKHTIPKSDSYTLDSSTTLATSAAVKAAVDASHSEVSGLNVENDLDAGEFITSLSQAAGFLVYSTDTMENGPVENSLKPVTGNALYEESHARTQFDDWLRPMIPGAASGQNQLVDKAYVDAIGERLEARYLSSYDAENNEYIPFPTYAAFEAAQQTGPSAFYYNGHQVYVLDNNDIVVITADERHLNEAGGPSTTRYRYQCNVTTGQDGHWYFEYVINNTALNLAQLMAINSGITEALRESYDTHLASNGHDGNPANPHRVTFDQLEGRNGVTSTELGVLAGVDTRHVGSDQLNTLTGIHIEEGVTIQSQLDDKVERVSPKYSPEEDPEYTASGKIAIIDDNADVNGRFGVEDSGAEIVANYNGNDTINPATGSAIKEAIDALDVTVDSTHQGEKVLVTVTETDGLLTSVVVDDSNAATAAQGAKADTAIQTVSVLDNGDQSAHILTPDANNGVTVDLSDYKRKQDPVVNPTSQGTSLTFIDTISQDDEGVITPTRKSVTVDGDYIVDGTNPASGTAITNALHTLEATVDSTGGTNVGVQVVEANGIITGVTVSDSSINANDLNDAITALDATVDSTGGKNVSVQVVEADGIITGVSVSDNTVNPTDLANAIDALDATVDSTGGVNVNVQVVENNGVITGVTVEDSSINAHDLATAIEVKADKVVNATEGDIATLDNTGNLVDSGKHVTSAYRDTTQEEGHEKDEYLANPVTGTAVDAAIAESASSDRRYVDEKIEALDATVESSDQNNVQVSITEVDGVLTGVTVSDNSINATDLSTAINALDATVATETAGAPASDKNFGISVSEENGVLTGVSIIRDNTINATDLSTAINALDATVATETADEPDSDNNFGISVSEENGVLTGVSIIRDDTVNATDVSNAITTAINNLDAEKTSNDGKNVQFKVTEVDGKITAVNVTTDNTINSTDLTTAINALDAEEISTDGKNVQFQVTETDGKITGVSVTTDNTVNATDVGNAITTAINGLDSNATSIDGTNVQVKVTETDGMITAVNITSDNTVNSTDVSNAIASAIDDLDVPAITGTQYQTITSISETDGLIDATYQAIKVGTSNIDDFAVTTDKIADKAVHTAKIDDKAVTTAKIDDKAVTTDKIGDKAVTTTKIDDDAVTTAKIDDNAVTTDKIDDEAVTTAKIDDEAVTTAKIDDGAVTYEKVTNDEEHPFPIDISGNASTATTADQAYDIVDGGTLDTRIEGIERNVASLQTGKADKVANAVSGNFAGLDANGNLTDTGVNANTFKTKQTAKSDPTASGTTITAIDTISQNANGEITATKKTIRSASTAQTGVVQLQGSIGATETENSKAATPKAVRDAIDGALENTIDSLDVEEVGGAGKYISAISETDGKISATVTDMDTAPTSASTNAVTSGGVYTAINNAVNALDATVSDSSTNVSVSVTETNGKLTAITVTDTAATSDHVHGNITNDGKVGSDANKVLVTTTGGTVTAGNIDGTYNASTNKIATQSTVTNAINALDVSNISGFGADQTLATLTETDGKISASFQSIQIAESQVTGLEDDLDAIDDALDTKEDKVNKVTSWSATTTDTNYPSEKLVKDSLDTKVDKTTKVNGHALSSDVTVTKGDVGLGSVVNTGDSDTPVENGTTKFTTGGAYTELNKKADKTATVSNVAYDGTNKKITKTINGTTSDVVTAATLKADMALDNVANTNITVSATDGVTDNTNNVTYKYTHPTFTATTAAAKKVGMNAEGHVVLGDSLTKADVGLGNVENTSITVSATDGVKDNTNNVTYKYVHPNGAQSATAAAAVKVGVDATGHAIIGAALTKSDVGLDLVQNQTITVTGTSVSDGTHTFNKYVHPNGAQSATAAAAVKVGVDATGHAIIGAALTKSDVGLGNVTNDAQVKRSEMGVANGVATLDGDGKVPSSQLPSYIDDVIEGYYYNGKFYEDSAHTILITPTSGKVYVDLDSNLTYRWGGTASGYVKIASDLALGETSDTAYRGDRGKTAYDHSQMTSGNPHNVTASDVGITVSAIDGVTHETVVDGVTHTVTYKYTHPTTTAVAASAKKVGYDNQGHVVLGDALVKGDVGLGNVDNTSDATKKTNFTGSIASGNTGFVTGGAAYTELNKKADKTATVSTVTYDTTNKKITKTINGTTTDVVTAAKLKEDMALDLVKNQAITVTSTSVSDGTNTFNKYTHPTYTAATAAAVKVGRDSTGHVTIGAALGKSDVGLGNVDNTSDDTKKANFTGAVASGNTGFPTGDAVLQAITANGKGYEIVTMSNTYAEVKAIYDAGKIPVLHETNSFNAYIPLTEVDTAVTASPVFWFIYSHLDNRNSPSSVVRYQRYSCQSGSYPWASHSSGPYVEITSNKVTSWSSTTTDTNYPSEKLVKTALDGKASSTHTHGNITNAGALQTTDVTIASGDKLVITDSSDSNKVARASASFDGTTTTKALTQKGTFEDFAKKADIDEAIEEIPTISLVGDNHITVTSDDTTGTVTVATDIAAQTAYIAKGSATKVPQITTNSLGQVTGITEVEITGVTPAAHTHGSITNDGKIGSTADLAVVTGTSGAVTTADLTTAAPTVPSEGTTTATAFIDSVSQDSKGKITASKKNLPEASTSTKGIVQIAGSIGTTVSSENNKAASEKAVRDAINALDVDSVGGAGKYISAISETNGKISATVTTMDTTPTANSTNAITSGGVASALTGYKPVQTAKSSPSASGNTLAFIDTISQDANGVITATKKTVTVDNALSSSSTNPVQNQVVNTALSTKVDTKTISASLTGEKYVKMTIASGYHHYLCFFNESLGDGHAEWMFRTYGDGGTARTAVNIIGGTFTDRKWYVAGSSGQVFYITMPNNTASQVLNFKVASLDGSSLPTLEWADSVPSGFVELAVLGVGKAEKFRTTRELAVNLANTSTTSNFDGSAAQTNIKVSGTLGISNGGTGATTATVARYNILDGMAAGGDDNPTDTTQLVYKYTSPTTSNGYVYYKPVSKLWGYIKGKMSSDSGVNISGNAATATTATDYNTSSGTIKSALDDKVSKVANTTLNNNVSTTWVRYGERRLTVDGNSIYLDMSAVTGNWAGAFAGLTDASASYQMVGFYGGSGALNYTYMMGSYSDPAFKITTTGIATFKNSLRVPSLSSSDGTYTYTLNSTKGGELALKEDVPAAVSVKGDAETTYRTGQVNLTPANLGISATTSSVTVGSTTFSKYSHPAGSAPSVTGFPAAGGTLSFGGTFDVNQVTTDSTSHVSSITKRTFTLPSLGTTSTTAAKGDHTHTASIAADTGTSALAMTANTKYKLTAGGSTFIFTTPKDTTYTSKAAASGGTDVSLVTTGEKWTWNHKQDALTEMTTAEVSALVAAFAS